jgi:ankyrin repeat protein
MRLLIEEGFADVDARDVRGLTPLMAVATVRSDHHRRRTLSPADEISQLLLDAGADLHAVDHHDRGVLHHVARHAVSARSLNCLRLFLAHGANPNLQDANGETPMVTLLSQARDAGMWRSVEEILLLLLHAGGDPFICDRSGRSAVQKLQGSDTGRAFLDDNSALFLHRQNCKSDAAL